MVAIKQYPIEVEGDKVTIHPEDMEMDRPYRFKWGDVEVFAVKRNSSRPVTTVSGNFNGVQTAWVNGVSGFEVVFYASMPKMPDTNG